MVDVDAEFEAVQRRFRPMALLRPLMDTLFPPCCSACNVRTRDHYALCSACWTAMRFVERPYCEVLGTPFAYDPGPGAVSADAIANPPAFDRLRTVALHEGPARTLVHGLKYLDRTDLAPMMAAWMQRAGAEQLAGCDAILPVPLHWTRLARRRYNQAAELARALSRLSQKPLVVDALVRRKRTRRQVGLTALAREDNLRAAFSVRDERRDTVFGKRLVIVDDVYTTGATVSAAAKVLRRAGAVDVTVLTFAMALREHI